MSDINFYQCQHCGADLPEPTADEERVACPQCGRKLSDEHPGGQTIAGGFHLRAMSPGTSRADKQKAPPPKASAPPPKVSAPPPKASREADDAALPEPAAPPIAAEQPSAPPDRDLPADAPPAPAAPAREQQQKPNLRLRKDAEVEPIAGPWYITFVKKSLLGKKERVEGPFTLPELRSLIRNETVTRGTMVRQEHEDEFQPAGDYEGLFKGRG